MIGDPGQQTVNNPVAIADRVLVVEQGRIIEDGSPAALIEAQGHYAGLHRAWIDSLA